MPKTKKPDLKKITPSYRLFPVWLLEYAMAKDYKSKQQNLIGPFYMHAALFLEEIDRACGCAIPGVAAATEFYNQLGDRVLGLDEGSQKANIKAANFFLERMIECLEIGDSLANGEPTKLGGMIRDAIQDMFKSEILEAYNEDEDEE